MHRLRRTLAVILTVCALCGVLESAAAKVSESVKLPVTGMKVTASYATGKYYTQLLRAMKESAGLSPAERFVHIAESQLGYTGSTSSGSLAGDGNGGIYTEYSNHRGVGGSDWCAAFVSWCAEAAGLADKKVLYYSNYAGGSKGSGTRAQWANPTIGEFRKLWSDDFKTKIDQKPRIGDLCLFMKSENTWSGTSHVEIVVSVEGQNSDGSWKFKTVGRKDGNIVGTETGKKVYCTKDNRSGSGSNAVRKFKGFYTPNWSAAKVWSASDVSGIEVLPMPGKPVLSVEAGSNLAETVLSWNATANTEYCTVRIYDANTKEELYLKGGITGTSFRALLDSGDYWAMVAAVNNTGEKRWTSSDNVYFSVSGKTASFNGTPALSRVGNGKKYNVYESAAPWPEVREYVRHTKGSFVSVTSQAEQQIVADAVAQFGYPCWLGGEAFLGKGKWQWSNEDAFTYTNWAGGQPSDGYGTENCIQMLPDGSWNDHAGYSTRGDSIYNVRGFIMEFEPVSVRAEFLFEGVVEGWPVERDALRVFVTFADGEEAEVADYTYSQSGIDAGTQTVSISWGGLSASVTVEYAESETPPLPDLVLPGGTLRVEEEAFTGTPCQYVYCPEGLESIGRNAFADCRRLVMIYIPENTALIDDGAFDRNSGNFWICGIPGSYAETYAEEHHIHFYPVKEKE